MLEKMCDRNQNILPTKKDGQMSSNMHPTRSNIVDRDQQCLNVQPGLYLTTEFRGHSVTLIETQRLIVVNSEAINVITKATLSPQLL